VEVPSSWPERGSFRKAYNITPEEKVILFLGRLSAKKVRICCYGLLGTFRAFLGNTHDPDLRRA